MQSLTNNEIAKVFALYFESEMFQGYENNGNFTLMSDKKYLWYTAFDLIKDWRYEWSDFAYRLALTPLENISDEDAITIAKMWGNVFVDLGIDIQEKISFGKHTIATGQWISRWEFREYLISRGYSVPMYFGFDHACNGKTPIELNIAIAK